MEPMTSNLEPSLTEHLERLGNVLDCEYQALLAGDGKTVAALADEKLRISQALEAARTGTFENSDLSAEIQGLAARIKESANLNHMLLKQLYQHYHGMLELFMRIGGKTRSYGKNGIVTIESPPEKGGEILA